MGTSLHYKEGKKDLVSFPRLEFLGTFVPPAGDLTRAQQRESNLIGLRCKHFNAYLKMQVSKCGSIKQTSFTCDMTGNKDIEKKILLMLGCSLFLWPHQVDLTTGFSFSFLPNFRFWARIVKLTSKD